MFEIVIDVLKNKSMLKQYLYCASVNAFLINK